MSYWVTLNKPYRHNGRDRSQFSVDGTREEVQKQVEEAFPGARILDIQTLPYPSEPRLNYKDGACPSFCMHPSKCAGRGSCPRSIACSE